MKISCSIGELNMVHYHTMLEKYAYNRMLIRLLGKHSYKELIRQYFFDDIIYFMTERDYSEALTVEFDMEIQSEEFGLKNTISIEGSTCEYYEKDNNDGINEEKLKMELH